MHKTMRRQKCARPRIPLKSSPHMDSPFRQSAEPSARPPTMRLRAHVAPRNHSDDAVKSFSRAGEVRSVAESDLTRRVEALRGTLGQWESWKRKVGASQHTLTSRSVQNLYYYFRFCCQEKNTMFQHIARKNEKANDILIRLRSPLGFRDAQ
jgi:hypothetical protein